MKQATFILMLCGALVFGGAGCGNPKTDPTTEHSKDDGHDHSKSDTYHHKGDEHNHKPGDTSSAHKSYGHKH